MLETSKTDSDEIEGLFFSRHEGPDDSGAAPRSWRLS